jgi:RNA polymerase sigma-70 factor, ECF subfamily
MNNLTPQQAVAFFNRGDTNAFAVVYDSCFQLVLSFVKKMIPTQEEAEEITSDAFLKLWQRRGHFENLDKVRIFLFTVAKNSCLDHIKYSKVRMGIKPELLGSLFLESSEWPIQDSKMAIVLEHIHAEIEKLPPRCRSVMKLLCIDGLKNTEVAALLGIKEKTVRNLKVKALRRLRMRLLK